MRKNTQPQKGWKLAWKMVDETFPQKPITAELYIFTGETGSVENAELKIQKDYGTIIRHESITISPTQLLELKNILGRINAWRIKK